MVVVVVMGLVEGLVLDFQALPTLDRLMRSYIMNDFKLRPQEAE